MHIFGSFSGGEMGSLFIYTKKFSSLYEVDGKKDGDIKRKFGRGVMLISGARRRSPFSLLVRAGRVREVVTPLRVEQDSCV